MAGLREATIALVTGAAIALGGCGGPRYGPPDEHAAASVHRVEYGYVDRIDLYRSGGGAPIGVGALLGGVAGGVLGHQIGGGVGNTVATIAGAVGGALVGNEVEKSGRVEGSRYRIVVRLDAGGTRTVEDDRAVDLRVGDRVRIEDNRVVRS